MGLNPDAAEARFREINEALTDLRGLLGKNFEELSVHERMSMRYLVIQIVEAAASVSVHLLSRLFDERAEGYADCFRRLGERKAIAEGLAERLASAARLRNLLVHRYWEVDDRRVYSSIKEGVEDFEAFKKDVRSFMEGTTS
jgi:uncharacterized protein YutE (UPF0331/DUF86 family)